MERWLGAIDEKTIEDMQVLFYGLQVDVRMPTSYLSIISCEVQTEDHQRECERLSGNLSVQLLGKPFNFALKRAERTNNAEIQNVDNIVNFRGSR